MVSCLSKCASNNQFTDNIQLIFPDLYGLFLFLGVEPYYRKTWWKKLLYEPFLRGDPKPLKDALYNVMWRTPKKDVIDEVRGKMSLTRNYFTY